MSDLRSIGELARQAEVPTSTVRYYERRGLLRPHGRSEGNYRQYGREALERLRFIRSAQHIGFTLSDIESLLRFRDGETEPCDKVQELIASRLEQVRAELAHLNEAEALLRNWLDVCEAAGTDGTCGVLDHLSEPAKGKKSRESS